MDTDQLISTFRHAADPGKALDMQRYMKDIAPYLGLARPVRDELQQEWLKHMATLTWNVQESTARGLWEMEQREFQYAAMDMLVKCKAWKNAGSINLFEYLITTKSWWDTVDLIASKLVGPYFLKFPAERDNIIQRWNDSSNIWLQRTSLIFQLGCKQKTDWHLMQACIIPLLGSREFFIQKAIGWALRQYARIAPEEVIRFVEQYPLKPLSRREALKHFPEERKKG